MMDRTNLLRGVRPSRKSKNLGGKGGKGECEKGGRIA